ncbi:MAG TPA: hypothetical protein VI934_00940 [Candidatus Nanoarchaeia archaeon]|nr:hypothetical protein [Candidatus Nanoarchaeia archaeon]
MSLTSKRKAARAKKAHSELTKIIRSINSSARDCIRTGMRVSKNLSEIRATKITTKLSKLAKAVDKINLNYKKLGLR